MKISGCGATVGTFVGAILFALVAIALGGRDKFVLSAAIGFGAAVGAIAGGLQCAKKGFIVGFILAAIPLFTWQFGFCIFVVGPNFGFDQIANTPLLVLREPLLFGLAGGLAGAAGVFSSRTKNTQPPVQRK